jgi:hypothetical protein
MVAKFILLFGVFMNAQFNFAHAESSSSQQNGTSNDLPPEAKNPAVIAAKMACSVEIETFCSGIRPGGGRIVRCLIKHKSQLSPICVDGMLKAKTALGR